MHTFYSVSLPIIHQYSSIDVTSYIKNTGRAEYFFMLTTASSLGILTTRTSSIIGHRCTTSANGKNCTGQHPCDGYVDTYSLNAHHRSVEHPTKLVPSSINNRWRVQTPCNMTMYRSQRDLPTPPLSLRVPPLPFVSDKSTRVSEQLFIVEGRSCASIRDLHAPLRKLRLSVQAKS